MILFERLSKIVFALILKRAYSSSIYIDNKPLYNYLEVVNTNAEAHFKEVQENKIPPTKPPYIILKSVGEIVSVTILLWQLLFLYFIHIVGD